MAGTMNGTASNRTKCRVKRNVTDALRSGTSAVLRLNRTALTPNILPAYRFSHEGINVRRADFSLQSALDNDDVVGVAPFYAAKPAGNEASRAISQ
jgi:hypothetical protein